MMYGGKLMISKLSILGRRVTVQVDCILFQTAVAHSFLEETRSNMLDSVEIGSNVTSISLSIEDRSHTPEEVPDKHLKSSGSDEGRLVV